MRGLQAGLDMRVLIVAQDMNVTFQIRRSAHEAGLSADIVAVGEEAASMAHRTEYSAIFVDAMLGGIGAFETTGRLRDSGVRAPVLMFSTSAGARNRVDTGGADPYTLAELLPLLRSLARP
jgi:DNA-binding response OmpR family regulator